MSAVRLRTGIVLFASLLLFLQLACGGEREPTTPPGGPPRPGNPVCSPGELTLADGGCQPAGLPPDMPCPPGELALEDGRCQPAGLPPDMPCPPGERALEGGRCQAAGVPAAACAPGRFVPDGRGGCEAILPREACPPGTMAVPGESACHEIAPCGDGPWGGLPVDATTQYVDQAYPGSDGDGSRQRPWTTIQSGVLAAVPGAIVAVAAGRYPEDVHISGKSVRLLGACPAQAEVVGSGTGEGAITLSGAGASGSEVRGLAATGPRAGVVVRGARSVTLERLWVHDAGGLGIGVVSRAEATVRGALIEQNHGFGVFVRGSDATIDATAVRGTEMDRARQLGRGVEVDADEITGARGTLAVHASLIDQNHDVGVGVFGADATILATVVRGTRPIGIGRGGLGIGVRVHQPTGERGTLALEASLIDQNHEVGVLVGGTVATIDTTVVRGTRTSEAGQYGRGVVVQNDTNTGARGTLALEASLIDQNHEVGVDSVGADATVDATVVRGTLPNGAEQHGYGVRVGGDQAMGERGALTLSTSLIEQNQDTGVSIRGSTATIDATVVRDTRPTRAGGFGQGVGVRNDRTTDQRGSLSLSASLIERNRDTGVFVGGSDATIVATVVRDTQPDGEGKYGWGVGVQDDPNTGERGNLTLSGALIDQNRDTGVVVGGSDATIDATVVRGTQINEAGEYGIGIGVVMDPSTGETARLWLSTSLIERNRMFGVLVQGAEATIDATVVRGTETNGIGQFGCGIEVVADARLGDPGRLRLSTSLIEQNRYDGVIVAGSEATIEATVVRGTEPNDAGLGGRGISVQPAPETEQVGRLWLSSSRVEQNHDVGVFVYSAEATIDATVVRETQRAPAGLEIGDGILVMDGAGQSSASITATDATDNARVGVLYVGSTGALSGVRSSGNRFGLVLQSGQSGAQPTFGEGNVFEGNMEQDRNTTGDLPVPDAAQPIP